MRQQLKLRPTMNINQITTITINIPLFRKISFLIILIYMPFLINCQVQEITKVFQNCHKNSGDFDKCMRKSFNDLRPYFKTGN